MDSIVCVLDDPQTTASILRAGQLLSDRLHDPEVRALHSRPLHDPSFMPTEEVMTEERLQLCSEREDARTYQIEQQQADRSASFQEVEGDFCEIIVAAARDAVLVVVGSPDGSHGRDHVKVSKIIRSLLAGPSAPVIVVPETSSALIAERIAIAWKRGTRLDISRNPIMALLLESTELHVLVPDDDPENEEDLEACIRAVKQRGVLVTIHRLVLNGRHAGRVTIDAATRDRCDLLVMFEDIHSWLEAMVFGSSEQDVLNHQKLPVLLANSSVSPRQRRHPPES
ncbi:MAG: universal stress protein [Janthinobacterium lividum]